MNQDVSPSELDYVQVDRALVERAIEALESAKREGLKVVTAESCTGGLVAMVLSEAPGAAEFLDGGFVTYTPEQKCAALELDPLLIERHGTVSAEVADAMARGALECSRADIAVSITGVAGPEPDERGNPVGLVHLACARKGGKCVGVKREFGDIGRSRIRYAAAAEALGLIGRVAGEQDGI
jgi:nicotinamide-nucleotide amidase